VHLKQFILISGVALSSACTFCIPGTYSERGQSSCITCNTGTYSTKAGTTSSAGCGIVTKIFQFEAPYLLEEITDSIKNRISLAVSNVLGVPASNVVLSFSTYIESRRLQAKVLVSVGIVHFQGSAASYASKVTQEKLNFEMGALGLKSGQVIQSPGIFKFHVNLINLKPLEVTLADDWINFEDQNL
jgi:hypothetical protein